MKIPCFTSHFITVLTLPTLFIWLFLKERENTTELCTLFYILLHIPCIGYELWDMHQGNWRCCLYNFILEGHSTPFGWVSPLFLVIPTLFSCKNVNTVQLVSCRWQVMFSRAIWTVFLYIINTHYCQSHVDVIFMKILS